MTKYLNDLTLNPDDIDHVFASGQEWSGSQYVMALHKSTNGGQSWTSHVISQDTSCAYSVTLDPHTDSVIYIGGSVLSKGALFKSTDGGVTWTELGSGVFPNTVWRITVHPFETNRILAATGAGLFLSVSGGASWEKSLSVAVTEIIVDATSPDEMYAGGPSGVYISRDAGKTWQQFNEGLDVARVNCLVCDGPNECIYAGTHGGGVYKNGMPAQVIQPPLNFSGVRKTNRSVLLVEYINFLTWQENPSNENIVKYRIYTVEEGITREFLVELDADTFEYRHRNVGKDSLNTYALVAVNDEGREGLAAYTTIQ